MGRIEPTSDVCIPYVWFAEDCLKLQSYGHKAISDGIYIIVCKYTPTKATLIAIGGGNFLCHPRS